jgi:serine/threonine-protein kinase
LSDDNDTRSHERVGDVLNDKWTLERLLGIGGMAAVYAARHRNGARAAVKVLHPDLSRHREVRERFLREGYAANRVDHPGAVKVMDDDVVATGPDAGTAYLVMELLEGESLQDRLERGPPVGEREFLAIAEAVLDVLAMAHGRGVVHRDLKPENLFLVHGEAEGEPPRVKVLDFGLARLLDGQTITSYGLALGTPSFMSPEQAAGRIDEIDGRTDLFSLAATGFRLRTGRRIHEGAHPVELVGKMANFAAPKIATYVPDVSAPFARVIDRALEFRREDRYAGAAEMRDDVQRALAEMDGLARTHLAVQVPSSVRPPARSAPPLPPALPPALAPLREGTMEVSERDLETSLRVEPSRQSLPVLPTKPRRRRRSLLPWLAVLVLAGIGTKLWLDARGGGEGAPGPGAASATATASVTEAATATATGSASASASETATATATATASATATATASAPGSATTRVTPTAPATAATRAPHPTSAPKPAHHVPPRVGPQWPGGRRKPSSST